MMCKLDTVVYLLSLYVMSKRDTLIVSFVCLYLMYEPDTLMVSLKYLYAIWGRDALTVQHIYFIFDVLTRHSECLHCISISGMSTRPSDFLPYISFSDVYPTL